MRIDWKQAGPALLLGALLGAAGGSWLQRAAARRWRGDPQRVVERMARQLELDETQKKAVAGALEARRARLEELRAATREEIRKVLNEEQKSRFDQMEARREARRGRP